MNGAPHLEVGRGFGQVCKSRCQLSMLGRCLEPLDLFWVNVNGLFPNPQCVAGDAQVSYSH